MRKYLKLLLIVSGFVGQLHASDLNLPYNFKPQPLVSFKEFDKDYSNTEFPKPNTPNEKIYLYVTSTNKLKKNAAKLIAEALGFFVEEEVIGVATESGVAEQPIGRANGILGAKNRIEKLKESTISDAYSDKYISAMLKWHSYEAKRFLIISIENFFENINTYCADMAAIVIQDSHDLAQDHIYLSDGVIAPRDAYQEASLRAGRAEKKDSSGFPITIGKILKEKNPQIDDANWHVYFTEPSIGRREIIINRFLKQ